MQNKIKDLGFELKKSFEHNEGTSDIFEKGIIQLDFTYNGDKLKYCDLSVGETTISNIEFDEVVDLDRILNKKR